MTIDEINAGLRGFIQGFKQSFYARYSLELKPNCFGTQSVLNEYQIYKIIYKTEYLKFYEIPGKIYALYLAFMNECQIEEFFYDCYVFCE